jgi:hypothetical protein
MIFVDVIPVKYTQKIFRGVVIQIKINMVDATVPWDSLIMSFLPDCPME